MHLFALKSLIIPFSYHNYSSLCSDKSYQYWHLLLSDGYIIAKRNALIAESLAIKSVVLSSFAMITSWITVALICVCCSSAKALNAYSPLLHSDLQKVTERWVLENIEARKEKADIIEIADQLKGALNSNREFNFPSKQANSTCVHSMETWLSNLKNKAPYSISMMDAWGKPGSGIEQGNMHWLGRYFECHDTKQTNNEFKGQWCSVLLPLKSKMPPSALPQSKIGFSMGVCVPSTCSTQNVSDLFNEIIHHNATLEVTCPKKHTVDTLDIITFSILAILTTLIALGTIYDLFASRIRSQALLDDGNVGLITNEEDLKVHETVFERFITSFSLQKNTKLLMNTKTKPGQISCLHGLRFISITWVLLGHTFALCLPHADNMKVLANYAASHFSFLAVGSGTFSVDTFFFLSGLLVAYLGLKEMTKTEGKLNVPLMYFHRYLRLTPPYALILLIVMSVLMLCGDGPTWAITTGQAYRVCQKYWWTNLLYINNLYPPGFSEECLGFGWYLANDMQFYVLSPIFLILLYRQPKIGLLVIGVVTTVSMAITGALSSYYQLYPGPVLFARMAYLINGAAGNMTSHHHLLGSHGNQTASEADKFGSDIYAKPWCRIGVYIIGMATGYAIHLTKGNLKMNKCTVLFGWIMTGALEFALVYGLWANRNPPFISIHLAAFYNAVCRPLWALGLSWICIACVNGYGGWVNKFLSWKIFIPLSRLTYCIYLTHPIVFEILFTSQEVNFHFSVVTIICYFLATVVLSCGTSYILSMLTEAPTTALQKMMFSRKIPRVEESYPQIRSVN